MKHRTHHPRPAVFKPKTTIYRGPKGVSVSTRTKIGNTTTTTTIAKGKVRQTQSTRIGKVTSVSQSSGGKTRRWSLFSTRIGGTLFRSRW